MIDALTEGRRWLPALLVTLSLIAGSPTHAAPATPDGTDPEDLVKLGETMLDSKEFVAAEQTLATAVVAMEAERGIFDPALIRPLRALAMTQQKLGQHNAAVETFDRAIHLTRVNHGLHSVSQAELIDELTDSLTALGQWQEANDRQVYAMYVQQRHFGPDNPDLVPGLYRLARWYRRVGNVHKARESYEAALGIIEADRGDGDLSLVPALQGLAVTYRLEKYPIRRLDQDPHSPVKVGATSSPLANDDVREIQSQRLNRFGPGEQALRRAVTILRNNPEVGRVRQAEAMTELGDWYLLFNKFNRAYTAYQAAHDLLQPTADDPQGHPAGMQRLFGKPVPLHFPVPARPPAPLSRSAVPRPGYVDVTYDVDQRGMVRDVQIVKAEPEGIMDFKTRRNIRDARYRPRFADGSPVATDNLAYRYNFTWYQDGPTP